MLECQLHGSLNSKMMPHWCLRLLLLNLLTFLVPWAGPFAQDASSVLQLNIEYRTVRNGASPTVEFARQLDALEVEARNATSEGQYGEAHRHLAMP